VGTSDDPVVERQRQLGATLADWRKLFGSNQTQLARRLAYDRATVAHAERGAQIPPKSSGGAGDRVLGANGALVRLHRTLQHAKRRQPEETAARARAQRRARLVGQTVGVTAGSAPVPRAPTRRSASCG